MPPDIGPILDDLRAEHADLDALVANADFSTPSAAAGWNVGDCVGHLWFFDREATTALVDPDAFNAGLERIAADADAYMKGTLDEARGLGDELLPASRRQRASLLDALARVDPATKVPWYGPPMSPASFATARLMEYWAHGQDIADGLGVTRKPTDRLKHICHLGVRTRGFSYVVHGRTVPTSDVHVVLTAPSGEVWTWGDPASADRVEGSALDFCLVVTQRRLVDDTGLVVVGNAAREWLQIAQAFAGGATTTDPTRRGLVSS